MLEALGSVPSTVKKTTTFRQTSDTWLSLVLITLEEYLKGSGWFENWVERFILSLICSSISNGSEELDSGA